MEGSLSCESLSRVWKRSRLVVLTLGLWACVLAQPDAGTRSVQGLVLDQSGKAVFGAVVQIEDQKTLQVRSFITQEAGTYHFIGLSTNSDYKLTASKEGATTPSKVLRSLDSRKKAVIDLVLK